MPELRYYIAPMLTGGFHGGAQPHRTHPFFRSRLNPTGPQVAHVSMMPLGKRDVGILAVTAEPLEHDAFVAAGAGVELPHRRNMRLADMSRLRDVLPLALIDSRISTGTPGWQAIRYLGRTAQFLQRVHGQFNGDVLDADRTRFAELGSRYAPLRDEPDFRTRLEGAVDLWPELLALRLGLGVDLGFDPAQPLPEAGDMALPMATQTFTSANGTSLGFLGWVSPFGNDHVVQSNQAQTPVDSATRFEYWDDIWPNDQYLNCQATLDGNYSQGPAVRIQTSSIACGGWWNVEPSSGAYLTEYVAGAGTDIDSYLTFQTLPINMEVRVVGADYEAFIGGVSRATATDSTWTSGKGGIGGYCDNAGFPVRMDDAYGDGIGGGAAAFNHHGRPYGQAGFNQMRQLLAR